MTLVWLIFDIISICCGFIGYINGIRWLLILFFVYYIFEMFCGIISGQLRNLRSYVWAVSIGVILAIIERLNIFDTIMFICCLEHTLTTLIAIFVFVKEIVKN